MRIVKEAEERRNEILDVASKLFNQKGFDGTSTNDILQEVGIARGTLYYHFKSKEDIMNGIIDRYKTEVLVKAQAIADDKKIPIVERMILVIKSLNISDGDEEIIEHIHKPQNALMHQKIEKVVIKDIPPILTGIVKEGIEEGMFETLFPYECMEMIVIYMNTIFDNDMVEMIEENKASRIKAFIYNTERMLGAEGGSLKELYKGF